MKTLRLTTFLFAAGLLLNSVFAYAVDISTAADLAAALAIWSDEKGVKLPAGLLAIGEIGLTGDLRPVQSAEKLVKEAARLGFKTVLLPSRSLEKLPSRPDGIKLVGVRTLLEAITAASQISQKQQLK